MRDIVRREVLEEDLATAIKHLAIATQMFWRRVDESVIYFSFSQN